MRITTFPPRDFPTATTYAKELTCRQCGADLSNHITREVTLRQAQYINLQMVMPEESPIEDWRDDYDTEQDIEWSCRCCDSLVTWQQAALLARAFAESQKIYRRS